MRRGPDHPAPAHARDARPSNRSPPETPAAGNRLRPAPRHALPHDLGPVLRRLHDSGRRLPLSNPALPLPPVPAHTQPATWMSGAPSPGQRRAVPVRRHQPAGPNRSAIRPATKTAAPARNLGAVNERVTSPQRDGRSPMMSQRAARRRGPDGRFVTDGDSSESRNTQYPFGAGT